MHIPEPIFIAFIVTFVIILGCFGLVGNLRLTQVKHMDRASRIMKFMPWCAVVGLTSLIFMLFSEAIYRSKPKARPVQAELLWEPDPRAVMFKLYVTNVATGVSTNVFSLTNGYRFQGWIPGTYHATISYLYEGAPVAEGGTNQLLETPRTEAIWIVIPFPILSKTNVYNRTNFVTVTNETH